MKKKLADDLLECVIFVLVSNRLGIQDFMLHCIELSVGFQFWHEILFPKIDMCCHHQTFVSMKLRTHQNWNMEIPDFMSENRTLS